MCFGAHRNDDTVIRANGAAAAIRIPGRKHKEIDLVFSEILMPGDLNGDGLQARRRRRGARHGKHSDIRRLREAIASANPSTRIRSSPGARCSVRTEAQNRIVRAGM